jgi:hypothetical protein
MRRDGPVTSLGARTQPKFPIPLLAGDRLVAKPRGPPTSRMGAAAGLPARTIRNDQDRCRVPSLILPAHGKRRSGVLFYKPPKPRAESSYDLRVHRASSDVSGSWEFPMTRKILQSVTASSSPDTRSVWRARGFVHCCYRSNRAACKQPRSCRRY